MAEIAVTEAEAGVFDVVVTEGSSTTTHRVTVSSKDLQGLPADVPADELVEASFRFLLDREPKESILRDFELGVISRYFPEYREKIDSYL